jgi:hypothetical protein
MRRGILFRQHRCLAPGAWLILWIWATAGCGSTYFGSPTRDLLDPSQPRDPDPVIIVSATGLNPRSLHVNAAAPTRIVNQDAVGHAFAAAPDQGYGDCPEMQAAGTVAPGETLTVSIRRYGVCAFRDVAHPTDTAFLCLLVVH